MPKLQWEVEEVPNMVDMIQSISSVAGLAELLKPTKATTLPLNEGNRTGSTPEEQEQQAEQVKKNVLVMAHFTMAFKTEALMSIIYKSMSTEWPTGAAHMVVAHSLE